MIKYTSLLMMLPILCLAWQLHGAEPGSFIRVACVGDSITFGAGVEDRIANNYPRVLGKLLGERYQVSNFGVNGATLLKKGDKPYWKLPAFKNVTDFQPHLVIIKLGTNDSKPQNWKYRGEYANDLGALIDHFQDLPSKPKIWLCKPAPVARTRWGINEKTVKGEVIPLIESVAKEKKLPIIDLFLALDDHRDLLPDGVHPNAAGAKIIAGTVHAAIVEDKPASK